MIFKGKRLHPQTDSVSSFQDYFSRMENHRLPKLTLHGKLSTGHKNDGTPKKRFKDLLKTSFSIKTDWPKLALDLDAWKSAIYSSLQRK